MDKKKLKRKRFLTGKIQGRKITTIQNKHQSKRKELNNF